MLYDANTKDMLQDMYVNVNLLSHKCVESGCRIVEQMCKSSLHLNRHDLRFIDLNNLRQGQVLGFDND